MIQIGNKNIGPDQSVYIVAEVSANHNQDINIAKKIIEAAKNAGADAVKLQTYTPDTMTIDCKNEYFKIKSNTPWDGQTLYDLYQKAYTPWEWYAELKEYADSIGITLFSTPFDKTSADFLETFNIDAYKIASFEAIDLPLVSYIATKNKPIIISTGTCNKEEIKEVVECCNQAGNNQVILLKCTSSYPAKPEEMNLSTILDMQKEFNLPVGLSDHTLFIETPITAVALGACLIEKHITLDRSQGLDGEFSLLPDEFKQMVDNIRNTEKLLGIPCYDVPEKNLRLRRSLFICEDIKKGEVFTEENIKSIRPGYGIKPKHLPEIIGKRATADLEKGTPMKFEYIEDFIVRNAEYKDMLKIHRIYNENIDASIQGEVVSLEDHETWFKRKLEDKNSVIYIIETIDNEVMGYVRFDKDDEWRISISLEVKFRGQGLGQKIIAKTSNMLKDQRNNPEIYAYIKKDNIQSEKSFAKAGYEFVIECEINNVQCCKYKY